MYHIRYRRYRYVSIFSSSDFDLEEACESEVKTLIMPTKSGRQEKITFRVSSSCHLVFVSF